jgi:hypothetical protein
MERYELRIAKEKGESGAYYQPVSMRSNRVYVSRMDRVRFCHQTMGGIGAGDPGSILPSETRSRR